MRVRIKSKRHCKRFGAKDLHGIGSGFWLHLASEVVSAKQQPNRAYELQPTAAQDKRGVLSFYIPKTAIAKRFKA